MAVSPGTDILAWALDTVGRRKYTLKFRDLSTGEELADEIPEITGNTVWANDDRTVFYTRQDPVTLRSYQVYRHTLGADPSADELVYEETDETFSIYLRKYYYLGYWRRWFFYMASFKNPLAYL